MNGLRAASLGLVAWLPVAACAGDGLAHDGAHDDVAGGQTGSASCGAEPDCVCDVSARAVLARAQVEEASELDVQLRVTEVLTPDTRLMPGELLRGTYQVGLPCGLGVEAVVEAGGEVLVAVDLGSLYLVPWQPELTLAQAATLPSSDVALLFDEPSCRAYFTPSTPRECTPSP